jgi:oligopeptide/dipeptide ABC transporter ATP-binding protein
LTLPEEGPEKVQQIILSGEMPSPMNPPSGCRFHTRCAEATEVCAREVPKMISMGKNHQVRCHHYIATG